MAFGQRDEDTHPRVVVPEGTLRRYPQCSHTWLNLDFLLQFS